jgi:co-chaperonin GroES (HSP10)
MRPIGKYILINDIKESIKTESGLILGAEDANLLRYKKGFILEVGSDVSVINKGDSIFYDSRAGYTMLINEKMCTIIMEKDVVVVL